MYAHFDKAAMSKAIGNDSWNNKRYMITNARTGVERKAVFWTKAARPGGKSTEGHLRYDVG